MRPGEAWGTPASGPADLRVDGDDRALATALQQHPRARIRFVPGPESDLGRAVGLGPGHDDDAGERTGNGTEVQVDTFVVDTPDGTGKLGVNMAVLGVGPWTRVGPRRHCIVEVDGRPWFDGRASSVVVASGQYHAGADLVPRGHPGDGRLEVQVYAVPRAEGPELRRRLPGGTHLPHPGIATTTGREIQVRWRRPRPLELDRERRPRTRQARITVQPGALTLVL